MSSFGIKIRKRTWEESFEALKRYKDRHGDCLVPIHNHHDDLALGGWVNHQRSKKAKLTTEQRQRLNDLGFTWSVRMRNKQWNEMLGRIVAYRDSHDGDISCHDDIELADFVREQMGKYHKGQLSGARQKQLEEIGLQLSQQSATDNDDAEEMEVEEDDGATIQYTEEFDQQYNKLVDFHVEHGHCDIPVESHALGSWVTTLRNTYKEDPETAISQECVELLEELGFDWKGPTLDNNDNANNTDNNTDDKTDDKTSKDHDNDTTMKEAEEKEEDAKESDNNNPSSKPESSKPEETLKKQDEDSPAASVAAAKEISSAKSDTQDDEDEELGSTTTDDNDEGAKDDDDDEDDEEDQKSKHDSTAESKDDDTDSDNDNDDDDEDEEEEEDTKPKTLFRRNSSLLLKKMRRPSLPKKKTARRMLSLPINPSIKPQVRRPSLASQAASNCPSRDERFMKQYQDLLAFKNEHGHCRVPQNKRYKTLGGWVNNLRVMYKRDAEHGVRPDRVKLLNEVGFIWNATTDMPSYDVRWEQQYENLLAFKRDFGHCRVPQTGPHRKLGRWVATQRALHTKDPMNGIRPDRLKRLNDVKFTWDAKGYKGKHFYTAASSSTTNDAADVVATKADSSATESDEDEDMEEEEEDELDANNEEDDDESVVAAAAVEADGATTPDVDVVPEVTALPAAEPKVKEGNAKSEALWMENYAKLVEFHKQYKHCGVPYSYDTKLAKWAKKQRQKMSNDNKNNRNPKHAKLLEDIEFFSNKSGEQPPSLKDVRWEKTYKQLVEFHKREGHCRVPQNGENKKLGKWVATHRLLYNKDPINGVRPDRKKLLDELGFTWNAKEFRSRRFSSPPTTTATKTLELTEEDVATLNQSGQLFPPAFGQTVLPSPNVGTNNVALAEGNALASGRIQPLVTRLCTLMDQDSAFSNDVGSKQEHIERYKRRLECMIDETKGRLDSRKKSCQNMVGHAIKVEPSPVAAALKTTSPTAISPQDAALAERKAEFNPNLWLQDLSMTYPR